MPDATFLGVALGALQHGKVWKCLGAHSQGHAHHQSQRPCGQTVRQTSITRVRRFGLAWVP